MQILNRKKEIIDFMDLISIKRDSFIKKNKYYYKDLINFLKYNIPENSKILEIGSGTGYLLNELNPKYGTGIDISANMVNIAKKNYPHLNFFQMDAEDITLEETFDFIIIIDTVGYFEDVQKVFYNLKKVSNSSTRIIITYQNFLWMPFFLLAELFKLKMPSKKLNWLNKNNISELLNISDFDTIKTGNRFLIPKFIPIISWFINKYFSKIPIINKLCMIEYVISRNYHYKELNNNDYSTSIIIPARNESGNIENAIKQMPKFGKNIEIIFIEGHSTDNTLEEIKRVIDLYKDKWDIKYAIQDNKGKGDAVRKGFSIASGEILMILDADLTVEPKDLIKFYNAISTGVGEFINGSRLVYPMEKEAMRFLNIIANKMFSLIFSWLLEQNITDTLCGTKVISKKNWEKLVLNRDYFGNFDPFGDFDLIFGASKLNLKIIEIPVRYKARMYGSTNISRFRHGLLLLKMVLFALNRIKFIK